MSIHPVWNHIEIEEYSAIEAEQITSLYNAFSQLSFEHCNEIKKALELMERTDEHFYYDVIGVLEAIEKATKQKKR